MTTRTPTTWERRPRWTRSTMPASAFETSTFSPLGVVPRAGATLDEESVRAFCRDRIAHYKVPRYIRMVEDFPTTVTGKVQKFQIRELMIKELGLSSR